jgi:hypothetical protein
MFYITNNNLLQYAVECEKVSTKMSLFDNQISKVNSWPMTQLGTNTHIFDTF